MTKPQSQHLQGSISQDSKIPERVLIHFLFLEGDQVLAYKGEDGSLEYVSHTPIKDVADLKSREILYLDNP